MNKVFIKLISLALSLAMLTVVFTACVKEQPDDGKIKIVTTLFPQYDFARTICGEFAKVSLLLDPGVESHSYDPTVKDINEILSCDLFIYTGAEMEPWVAKVLQSVGDKVTVLDLSQSVILMENEHTEEHQHSADPHYWLNMQNAIKMCDAIYSAVIAKDSANANAYTQKFKSYRNQLDELHTRFTDIVASSDKTVVFGGRFAYAYFADAYSLKYKTVYTTCSTSVEPSAKTISEITDFVKGNSIKYIYHEELSDPKTARSIAESTGAQLLEFSTAHNVSKDDYDNGITFENIMERNYQNLKKGLQ